MNRNPRPAHGISRAISTARRAAQRVPAYAKHLAAHGKILEEFADREGFERLPPVTKEDYIKANNPADLLWDGDLSRAGVWSASSGSSGEPTFWPRAQTARDDAAQAHDRIFSASFDTRALSTLVIDAFAMGTWIGGTYTYTAVQDLQARGHLVNIVTPGIDVEAVLQCLERLGKRFDQVILAGYPPVIKDVLDATSSDLSRLGLLLAGEAISEGLRDYFLNRLDTYERPERVCLVYGTADAGLMGHETPETIAIRRAARPGTALAEVLFGGGSTAIPTLVEYDPERRYAEVNDEGLLYFTVDTALPLIRYQLGDRGELYSGEQLAVVLREGGYADLAAPLHPRGSFLILRDRTDVAATFYGANIYAEHVKAAMLVPEVMREVSGRFTVSVEEDAELRPQLLVVVEAMGTRFASDLGARLAKVCRDALAESNTEYRRLLAEYGTTVEPRVAVVPRGDQSSGPHIKQKWIEAN
ncbi:phenylacetate--CoA ligase family protein [Gordonia phosphorivorans]|uniref:Phenylacetate--CoA ligase family protein n=1 Tax=Gordonia phosphorivorans TaxID=1056982 RepID=A0ABV6H491_9ACTN